jgi:lipopolysaccharide export system protein LptA
LDTVAGRGNTLLHQVKADGIDQTSSGNTLDAKFRANSPLGSAASVKGSECVDDLLSAVQQGHVTMTRRAPAKNGGKLGGASGGSALTQEDFEQATANRAAYDGDLDRVTLSGGVQVSDSTSALWADQVVMNQTTGDAHATGSVKVNYLQANSAQAGGKPSAGLRGTAPGATATGNPAQASTPVEPTHVLADRADLVHATGVATFYGRPVRLWQTGSQVQAPVIELEHVQQRMTARGVATASGAQVHTILSNAGSGQAGADKAGSSKAGGAKTGAKKAVSGGRLPSVVRIASSGLVYSGDLRQAEFTGSVRAETVDGTIRANQATVYLQPAGDAAAKGNAISALATPSLAGELQRMVATGQIEIEQPERHATGERLVYTASDGLFVLTGDGKTQPRLVDAVRGTITGAALQFHSGDDSVVVTDVEPGATNATTAQRVITETHMNKDASIGKRK